MPFFQDGRCDVAHGLYVETVHDQAEAAQDTQAQLKGAEATVPDYFGNVDPLGRFHLHREIQYIGLTRVFTSRWLRRRRSSCREVERLETHDNVPEVWPLVDPQGEYATRLCTVLPRLGNPAPSTPRVPRR